MVKKSDKEILVLVVQVTTRFAVEEIFFLRVRKDEKLITDELNTYKIRRRVFFCPTSRSSQESEGFLFRRATYKGTYEEAVESASSGLSPKKGDVRKKRRRPTKATRRGREKEEKKNT